MCDTGNSFCSATAVPSVVHSSQSVPALDVREYNTVLYITPSSRYSLSVLNAVLSNLRKQKVVVKSASQKKCKKNFKMGNQNFIKCACKNREN